MASSISHLHKKMSSKRRGRWHYGRLTRAFSDLPPNEVPMQLEKINEIHIDGTGT